MISEDLIRKVATNVTEKVGAPTQIQKSAEAGPTDIETMSRQLHEIQHAVSQLEIRLRGISPHSHALPVIDSTHPSQELFDIPEEVTEFVDYLETKQCVLDPGKPCIGRGECRSRGF